MTRPANRALPERILEEALKIVVEQGHESLNMRELARRVDTSATAIYHYYRDKAALILLLKLRGVELLNSRIRQIDPGLDPMVFLHQLGREYIGFAEENPNLYRLVFETLMPQDRIGDAEEGVLYYTYRAARAALERLAARGREVLEPRYGAMMGWVVLHGFSSLLLTGGLQLAEGIDREELKEQFLRFYSSGGRQEMPNA